MSFSDEPFYNLGYLNFGKRIYEKPRFALMSRDFWEFQAVIRGGLSPVTELDEENIKFSESTLWVFSPDKDHSWVSKAPDHCEIVVFHFYNIDKLLKENIQKHGGILKIQLTSKECQWIRTQYSAVKNEWQTPNQLSYLTINTLLNQLTLLVLNKISTPEIPLSLNREQSQVNKAIEYYKEHFIHQPGIAEISKQVGISEVHLRRLFRKVTGTSPKKYFAKIQFEVATKLLLQGNNIEEITEICGFSNPSAFGRAFKSIYNKSPRAFRSELINNKEGNE